MYTYIHTGIQMELRYQEGWARKMKSKKKVREHML